MDEQKRNSHITNNVTVNQPTAKSLGVLERDWTTALLLSIFLGGLGIDQFYLGKTGKGILKLLTCGLFGILWVIDIIMIATKSVNHIVWKEKLGNHMENSKPKISSNWFAQHKVASGILGFVLFIIIVSVANGGNKNVDNKTSTGSGSSNQSQQSTSSSNTPAKPAARQVTGTATTLGTGTFTGGTDVAAGLYDVTTSDGQSGNFIVNGTDTVDEILGVSDGQGVPKIRVQISKGDQIQISGLTTAIFTPVTTPFVTAYATANLYAGTFTVGQDIGAGRYVATTTAGSSGNFIVNGTDTVDEILGVSDGQGVPTVTTNLTNGDIISISGLDQVTLTPTK